MQKLIGSAEQLRKECYELKRHLDQLNSPIKLVEAFTEKAGQFVIEKASKDLVIDQLT